MVEKKKTRRRRTDDSAESSTNLNQLPYDILVNILSRLEVKEAVRTCVVSRRFSNLWTSSTTYDDEKPPSSPSSLSSDFSIRYCDYASVGIKVVRCRNHASTKEEDNVILVFDKEDDDDTDYSSLRGWIQTVLSPSLPEVVDLEDVDCMRLLKHLEFRDCYDLKHIEVGLAPNLESLALAIKEEQDISISGEFENLTSVSLRGPFCFNKIPMIQRDVPEVEKLELNVEDLIGEISLVKDQYFEDFVNLDQVKLVFKLSPKINLVDLAGFIMACPLQKLTLEYQHDDDKQMVHHDVYFNKSHKHRCLEVVEFIGWRGNENEVQFANYVMKMACHLRDLVLKFDQSLLREEDLVKKKAIDSARQLMQKLKKVKSRRPKI